MTNCFGTSNEYIYIIFVLTMAAIVLFFWGIYKAIKTQKTQYAWAMLPFFIIMALMFIR